MPTSRAKISLQKIRRKKILGFFCVYRHISFLAEPEQVGAQPDVDLIQVNKMHATPDIAERLKRTGPVVTRWFTPLSVLRRINRKGCVLRLEMRLLAMMPGLPVFHLVRTAYGVKGEAVEVCDTIMSADQGICQ
jgi:hypothetical protein